MLRILCIGPSPLLHCPRIILGCCTKNDQSQHLMVEKVTIIFNYSFHYHFCQYNATNSKCALSISGVRGGVSTISTRYCKETTGSCSTMMKRKRSYTSWIWMPIIFMVSNTKICSNLCTLINNLNNQ